VLGRVHGDDNRRRQTPGNYGVGETQHPAALRGIGLPVVADGVDVVGLSPTRTGFVGISVILSSSGSGTRCASLEDLERRPSSQIGAR